MGPGMARAGPAVPSAARGPPRTSRSKDPVNRLSSLAAAAAAILAVSPAISAAAPASAKDVEAALQAIVSKGALAGARVGILVERIDTGQVLFAKDPDVLLNPASNVKLFTTAAALARLGPDFRFATEVSVDAASAGKPAVETLYVRGKGDPTMTSERLWVLAGDLAHLGLRRVGALVVDEGYFDGERRGPGFDQEDGDHAYLAPAGALALNHDAIEIHVAPGDRPGARARVEVEPASDYFTLDDRAVTVRSRAVRRIVADTVPDGAREKVVVQGRIPAGAREVVFWRKIDAPATYFGQTLRRYLALHGVRVGQVRTGTVPPDARLVQVAESDALAEVVRQLMKTSNNFMAEQLLKTLGAEVKGVPGSWPKGVAAVEDFLAEAGIPRGAYVMRNGSGLNDTNRFSARQTVTLLRAMWSRFPLMPEFVAALPVAGRDGTIRWRMEGTDAVGHLRAKTGTLEGVTSLSGYVETADAEKLAFAIFVNDYAGRSTPVVRAVDAIGGALAAIGGSEADVSAAVASASPAAPASPAGPEAGAAELRAAVKTYLDLARAGDARNVPFLRTALRTEKDPALRMAIGEAVYLSDPDSDAARRALLDAAAADPAALGRLLAAAPDDADPPVLRSLADLAADGDGEALARLVDLAQAEPSVPALAQPLEAVLDEVAASAPDELVEALRAAPPASADAAIAALARGLVRGEDGEAPMRAALAAQAAKDGVPGAFARALEARLRDALQAARAPAVGPAPGAAPAATAPEPIPASVPAAATRPGG